jgi:hypothetical protein
MEGPMFGGPMFGAPMLGGGTTGIFISTGLNIFGPKTSGK